MMTPSASVILHVTHFPVPVEFTAWSRQKGLGPLKIFQIQQRDLLRLSQLRNYVNMSLHFSNKLGNPTGKCDVHIYFEKISVAK